MARRRELVTNRRIRVAVVGCGRIAVNHFNSIEAQKDQLQLVAVCDTDPKALRAAEEKYHVTGFDSLDELLHGSDADLVVLCTPSGMHPAQAIQVARAGKHVMTEKPMATRWTDGIEMVREADEAGVRLFVVKQNRRNATLRLLKQAMEKRRFGRIYMVTINVFWTRPQSYYDTAKWRGTWEFDGGALMNQASHYIDLVDWLIGPVESVQAYVATLARDIQVEDTATVGIRWRAGALGSVNVTMLTYPKNLEGSITIIGEKGTVRVGGVAVNEIQTWDFSDQQPEDEGIRNANYETTSVYGFGHPLYYDNVIKVLRGEADPETDGREGLRSLELLIASYMSARDGRRVALPLQF
ncbi:UDP-N-acetyl-2-amino-2-deoxyglucuronate dehydrogenase [Povalibacter uvarum]|uniref:UDP-N-acetyl-2-amino-2-deoxyglucuronate dehydrogenase n=1 Tax=Povalibacter uvarum TaxID=732238 RepID=A0A841HFQ2_9GAMM|nr:Gfo/Idh/MocA family oxidoreductase [Povalibacter uvarum]MBB6091596.1 UDP-N-acetyl-2-amino-2-deoxyglucuronate dehydrogenase [Povalibacter uvarum]